MNDPHQIAADAWRKLQNETRGGYMPYDEVGIAITKAAIEKATEELRNDLVETTADLQDAMTRLESRAAHASEPWTRYRNKVCDGSVIGEAKTNADADKIISAHNATLPAHASDDFKRVQELATQMVAVREALGMPKSTFEEVLAKINGLMNSREAHAKAVEDAYEAARKLCELYFNIAAEVIGEDEVRKRRDAMDRIPRSTERATEKKPRGGETLNNLNIGFEAGTMLPSELANVKTWTDVTTPIGKATQIYFRALEANGLKPVNAKFADQRRTEAHERRTLHLVEIYHGKLDLLRTWEAQPDPVLIKYHDEIIRLRATVRKYRNYLANRSYDVTI